MPVPRTRRQREIFDHISDFIVKHGHQPSYQQIANHFKLRSKGGIAKHITALEEQGFLTRRSDEQAFSSAAEFAGYRGGNGQSDYAARMARRAAPRNRRRMARRTAAHLDRAARSFRAGKNSRLHRRQRRDGGKTHLRGRHRANRRKEFARDGDIIVAVIEKKRPVLKTFYRAGAFVELRPANKVYETIRLPANKLQIAGVFRGLLRPLS